MAPYCTVPRSRSRPALAAALRPGLTGLPKPKSTRIWLNSATEEVRPST